jgi:hypothetical protein
MRPISNRKQPTMEIEQRNELAAIMFDIKDKIKDGEYKQFMDILGKKEPEIDVENIRLVRLYYIHYEYLHPLSILSEEEYDTLQDDGICEFKQDRLKRRVKSKIVEVYGKLNDTGVFCREKDLDNSKIHVYQLRHFIKKVKEMNRIEDAESIQDVRPYTCLSDTCWIHPLKYTVMD